MVELLPQTRIVAFDLETTGLSSARHRIVELAAVCWQNGHEIAHFQALADPGVPIPDRVTAIHGISDAMVAGRPPVRDLLPAFLAFCQADILVAHNAPFDLGFLQAECARNGLECPGLPVRDSCALARRRLPHCPNFKLETLKAALGLGYGQAHRALEDARDCLAVFLRCQQRDMPVLQLPLEPPPLDPPFWPLSDALRRGVAVTIEYRDARGRVTSRVIEPIHIDGRNVVAYCHLRNDRRHFALNRIERILPE